MTKIVTIVGARPQFIKAAVVSRQLRELHDVCEILVHTGQHYDGNLSQVFFDELSLPQPDYFLGVGSGKHGAQTAKMLGSIEELLESAQPDWVLLYGDTNTTLAGALAAAKLNIPIAHIEAGLRSFNRRMPEEVNRVLTDHVSQLLFAPTEAAAANLLREGFAPESIHLVGDVMYDAALFYGDAAARSQALADYGLTRKDYVLATIHRAENTDDPARLRAVLGGLMRMSEASTVAMPLHPRTRSAIGKLGLLDEVERRLRVLPPVGYLDMIALERGARLIATDSGGVQKEAYFHRVPCVTLRDETEWVELVEGGWNRLVPPFDADAVYQAIRECWESKYFPPPSERLYGGGQAARRIVEQLVTGVAACAA